MPKISNISSHFLWFSQFVFNISYSKYILSVDIGSLWIFRVFNINLHRYDTTSVTMPYSTSYLASFRYNTLAKFLHNDLIFLWDGYGLASRTYTFTKYRDECKTKPGSSRIVSRWRCENFLFPEVVQKRYTSWYWTRVSCVCSN